ncbi:Outer membrane protein assembly factor BamB precursor [Methylophaga muralis]|uniref:Outer membrane protein assembly factor BamB n=2 Tax=Methylophaga muralis TaxID=291169 RepID=A0A1E3GQJ3_9GAMM|nr:Outer membrane protein assembly factor BamB precursor [Methylophaga muralis]
MMRLLSMKANLLKNLFIGIVLTALAGCGTIKEFFAADAYEAPPAELTEFQVEFEPKNIWSTNTGDGANTAYANMAPWLQGNSIVTVDHKGDVRSHNIENGRREWRTRLNISVASGVGGGEGLIVVGAQSGEVVALDESTGKELWRQRLSSEVLAPPKVGGGSAVVRTADGRLTALSASNGNVLWNYQRAVPLLSLRGVSAPIIEGQSVLAGYDNGKLVALSLNDGKVIWDRSVAIPSGRTELERLVDIDADPVIHNGIVYVVAFQGNLAAMDVDTGQTLWDREMSSTSGIAVDPFNAVYVSDDQSYLWAIADGTGDSLWRQTLLLRRSISAPVIAGDNVVVGDFEGYLHWVSRSDGRFVARQRIDKNAIRSQPIVRDGVLYVMTTGGKLTAIRIP